MLFKNQPAFITAIFLIIGIYIGWLFDIPFFISLISTFIVFVLLIVTFLFKRFNSSIIKNIFTILLIVLIGIVKITIDGKTFPENHVSNFLYIPQKIILTGTIEEEPHWRNNRLVFLLNVQNIFLEKDTVNVYGRIICYLKPDTLFDHSIQKFDYGDKIFAVGRLNEPIGEKNPGEFSYKKYLEINDIYGVFQINGFYSVRLSSKNNGNIYFSKFINPVRKYIINEIDKSMGPVEGSFLKGLLIGDRSEIPEEVKESFINAGVIHILAISGLNVAFIIIIFSGFFNLFPLNEKVKTLLIIASIIFYMFLIGNSPSIVRASIMGITYLIGKMIERKSSILNSLAVAAIIILFFDSKQLFDISFQLSFICIFSLAYFYPLLKFPSLMKDKLPKNKLLKKLIQDFIIGFAVSLGIFPILILTTGKISIISLLVNLIVVPLSNISLGIGLLQILTGLFNGGIASIIIEANQFLLWFCLKIIAFTGNTPFSYIELYSFNTIQMIVYYIILFTFFFFLKKNKMFAISLLTILIFNFVVWNSIIDGKNQNEMRVSFIDVGQGDAALFELPNNKNILIDAGPKNDSYDAGEKIVFPFLRKHNINKIDYLILTHRHDDHIGGALYLIDKIRIHEIILSPGRIDSKLSNSLDSLFKTNNIKPKYILAGSVLNIDNVRIFFLNPTKRLFQIPAMSKNSTENNWSIVLKIVYGNSSVLMCGDIEKEAEEILCRNYSDFLQSNILKISHHGGKNSSTSEFLKLVYPQYGIISVSALNSFNQPSVQTLRRLKEIPVHILRTDIEGAIIFETDGKNFRKVDWR